MSKSQWWNPFSWGEEDPSIMTQTVTTEDKSKKAVNDPLSAYLASDVGKGLPRYTGDFTAPLSTQEQSNLSGFLSMDPNTWFQTNVSDPAFKNYQENTRYLTDEGYAGALRGSGRYAGGEAAVGALSAELAKQSATTVPEITQMQFDLASKYKDMQDKELAMQYADWFQSLPENNPILDKALQYLNASTGTGTDQTVLSATNPGKEGWVMDLLKIAAGSTKTAAAGAAAAA